MPEFLDSIDTSRISFNTSEMFYDNISGLLNQPHSQITHLIIGQSEKGRPIHAFRVGNGKRKIALLGGAHSDEPVGPQTLRLLVSNFLDAKNNDLPLLNEFTFLIIPHINPDGEAENWKWIKHWPDLGAYAAHAFREAPGRDLEFGYPDMRLENKAVSAVFKKFAPFDLYINFHGMALAEGIMLLIERHWIEHTKPLRNDFKKIAKNNDLSLHDHDRKGEKGFLYIGPGFTTTPEGRAMQKHFKEKGEEETASKFHLSSMEFIRSLGGNPLCLVTELPLYLVSSDKISSDKPGVPSVYLAIKKRIPEIRRCAINGEPIKPLVRDFNIKPLALNRAAKIHLAILGSAIRQILP